MSEIFRRTLSNGAVYLAERIDTARSAVMHVTFPLGHASDPTDRLGLSSIVSELALRGAGDLDARAQADAFDRIGCLRSVDVGSLTFGISLTTVGSRLHEALPLLADMILRPAFPADQLEACRELSLQALASLADDPQERVALAARARHRPEPLNRSGYGDEPGLRAVSIDDVRAAWSQWALPKGAVIAVAGDVDPEGVASTLDGLLSGWTGEAATIETGQEGPRGYAHETDQSNQVQILLAQDAPAEREGSAMVERVLTGVLSGGMSSRLFSEVREKRGLCYAVSASYRAEKDFGVRSAYVGTTPERAQESLDVLAGELERVGTPAGRVAREEFDRAVVGLKSRVVFAGESTGARAGALISDERKLGRVRTLDQLAAEIDAVTIDQVNAHAEGYARGRATLQTLGPDALKPAAGID